MDGYKLAENSFSAGGAWIKQSSVSILQDHYNLWGVIITDLLMNNSQATINTDIALPYSGAELEAQLGFPLT